MMEEANPKTNSQRNPTVFSVFTGAGGLDLGLERAGFVVAGTVELDPDSVSTLRKNRPHWPCAMPGNIHLWQPKDLLEKFGIRKYELDLLSGGPPCQPFSRSGNWVNGRASRMLDPRASTIPAFLSLASLALPKAILIENVPGISDKDLRGQGQEVSGFEYIQDSIEAINRANGTSYKLTVLRVNAADYGVSQHRNRVFFYAERSGKGLVLPEATHGAGRRHRYSNTWDAIGGLESPPNMDELRITGRWSELLPSIPEGKNYLWHTEKGGGMPLFGWRTRYWTFLLKLAKSLPSWTLQAKPGPSTGPFHWENRRLSVAELARLQTFPENYEFCGSHRSQVSQVGNAVPSAIGELFGRSILGKDLSEGLSLIPKHREDLEPATPYTDVPERFWHLSGFHVSHPGTGKGPRALGWLKV